MNTKICTKCKVEKRLDEYHNNKYAKNGKYCWCKDCRKAYYLENKEYYRQYNKKYREANKDYYREYKNRKYASDGVFRLTQCSRRQLRDALRGNTNPNTVLNGKYTVQEFRNHIESQFTGNMNWDNYGVVWQIDHMVPVCHFEYKDKEDEEFLDCWSLLNLQPLLNDQNVCKMEKDLEIRKSK